MMNTKEELDFIKNVEKFPCIYDLNSQQHNLGSIKKAFEKIAEEIKYEYPDQLSIKWRSLRQKYIKLRNLDPTLDEKIIEKNEDFLKAMSFLDDFDLDEAVEAQERDISYLDDDDPHYEDAFIAEVKKYSILYNIYDPDHKKTKVRQQIWEEISDKFGMDEKKLQLKWKNLKRKYILMRYPQSSKNAITQKRKIKYSQKFVDKMQFLDKYLEHAQMYDAVNDSAVYEKELKRLKLEYSLREPKEGETSPKPSPSPKRKIAAKKERPTRATSAKAPQREVSSDEDDDLMEDDDMKLEAQENNDEHYEDFIEDVDYLAVEDPDSQGEEVMLIRKDPIDTKENQSSVEEEGSVNNEHQRTDNEHFCLSLIEPITGLSLRKQVLLKTKIWNLIAESYNS